VALKEFRDQPWRYSARTLAIERDGIDYVGDE
jgi:hypothetical protein